LRRFSYDLRITRGSEPLIELKQQPNATQSPRSALRLFSFAGSVFEDDSNVCYYVDEVMLTSR
jgi:hypothetical protein